MKKRTLWFILSVLMVVSFLMGCGGQPAPEVTEEPVVEATEETVTGPTEPPELEPTVISVPEEPEEPKILRMRILADIKNLDPAFMVSGSDDAVATAVMQGLVTYCPNSYDICNELAESIETSEDGLEISFKLREGVQWHEGYGEVTTEDVKFSLERFIDPDSDSPYADDWSTLDRVEIVDKYRGKIVFSAPLAPVWHSTLPVSSGWIVPKEYLEKIGPEAFATDILGTGPYMFEEWRPQERITLVKNPDYYGEEAYYDEIHLIPIEDDKAAEVALEAGEVEWSIISISSVQRYEEHPELEVWRRPSLNYSWFAFNVQHPKLQDINVRKAIQHAIDVPSILQAAYMGEVERQCTLIPPGLLGHWDEAPCPEYDLGLAQEYMDEAGVESLDLQLDLQDTSEYRTWGEIAQQNLKEIGINLELNPMETSTFYQRSFGEDACENNELMTSAYSMNPDPSWATMWFTCDQVEVWNTQCWCNEEFDRLHREGLVTIDNDEREQIYIQMQKIWEDAAQTLWVTHGAFTYGYYPTLMPATTPHGVVQTDFFKPAE